jgi:hypothetical protein
MEEKDDMAKISEQHGYNSEELEVNVSVRYLHRIAKM